MHINTNTNVDYENYLRHLESVFSDFHLWRSRTRDAQTRSRPPILPAPLAEYSYRTRVPAGQRSLLNAIFAAIGIAATFQPAFTAVAISWGLFVIFSLLITTRFLLLLVGAMSRALPPEKRDTTKSVADLPLASVMVAAYQEAPMMPQLASALRHIHWPAQKLEIFILLEADDGETIEAAQNARFPKSTRLIKIPPGGPRTKPNALNHGLSLARGQFVTVYDVEDTPHPDQIHAAFDEFCRAPANTVCVQAPLNAGNAAHNWITAQWALEYDVQFGLLMPGLSHYHMPILLGGTSNHIRRDALLAMGGWDAWNVTEDADLGMRLARAGLRTRMIHTPTYEMAPPRFPIWFAQRSRWLKGFVQTWLVLMRNPLKTCKQMGAIPFAIMQLTLGGAILTPLAQAPFAMLIIIALGSGHLEIGRFGLGLLVSGVTVGLIGDVLAPGKWTKIRILAVVTRPIYWPLHSLAAYRALWELAKAPFFWAKTPHQPRTAESPLSFSTGS